MAAKGTVEEPRACQRSIEQTHGGALLLRACGESANLATVDPNRLVRLLRFGMGIGISEERKEHAVPEALLSYEAQERWLGV